MSSLPLTPDELLSTTRAVRKRLDFTRPVERAVLEECLALAVQAPSGSNRQRWHFVMVTDPDKRQALAGLYRRHWDSYRAGPTFVGNLTSGDPARDATQARVASSAQYLADHFHEAPVLVVPCISGRRDGLPTVLQGGLFASILPAVWSFMLAARSRGLGTCLTTLHLESEQDAAKVLGIPYPDVMQVALIPVAYTIGTDFKSAPREPLDSIVHWDGW